MAKNAGKSATPILFVPEGGVEAAQLEPAQRQWLDDNGFCGQLGRLLPVPGKNGALQLYVFGTGPGVDRPALVAGLAAARLDPGHYALGGRIGDPDLAALGFELGAYRFTRYKKGPGEVTLAPVDGAGRDEMAVLADAAFVARDLVNTPASDLGPEGFEHEIRIFARRHKMAVSVIAGDDLLARNFPLIHAVGRASAEAPRLIDLSWGPKDAPKVTLAGKGVTFDSGGLDIKAAAGMVLMKKDMGGAANVLGLARAITGANLNIRLRVLLPVVENAISGASYRPGDVLRSRAGLSVEIGNTDAEGRLVLADALALADEESPDLIVDMATLTGAARIALGPDLPPLYSQDDGLVRDLAAAGEKWGDPLWPMPLWTPYGQKLNSTIADLNHITPGFAFAGSVTAALFLQRFVKNAKAWAHLDIFAWAPEPRPGRPAGGTDQGIRATYQVLKQRYGAQ